jgi:hypothetical protein
VEKGKDVEKKEDAEGRRSWRRQNPEKIEGAGKWRVPAGFFRSF